MESHEGATRQSITVQGGHNVIAQAGRDLTQHVHQSVDQAELRQVVEQLTEAIRSLDRSVTDRAVALTIAQQVTAAVEAPDRDPEELADHWTWLGRFADSLAVLGAPSTVTTLYQQAQPLMAKLLEAPPMLPNALT